MADVIQSGLLTYHAWPYNLGKGLSPYQIVQVITSSPCDLDP